MKQFLIVGCVIFLISLTISAEINIDEIEATVKIVDNIEKFKEENPGIEWIPMIREEIINDGTFMRDTNAKQLIRYTAGNRVSGDRVVGQASNRYTYPSPQDVRLTLQYPVGGGVGSIITFIDILVDQSYNNGEAIIAAGGIGQRQIVVLVNSYGTSYFNYAAQIYGR